MFSIKHLPRRARRVGTSTALASFAAFSLLSGMAPSASAQSAGLSVSIDDVAVTEGVDAYAVFTVTVTGKHPNSGITVDYETQDRSATAGLDYDYVKDTLPIAAGDSSGTISIPIIDDDTHEPVEKFVVKLLSTTSVAIDPNGGVGTATITSDDPMPKVRIHDAQVTEGDGPMIFDVVMDRASSAPVTVDYKTLNDTAVAGDDYVFKKDTVTFPANSNATQQIQVDVKDDNVYAGTRDFQVKLSNNFNANIARDTGTGTIEDDEVKPILSVDGDFAVSEGDDTHPTNVVVRLSGLTRNDVTYTYRTFDGSAPAAHEGSDYVGVTNGSGTVRAGTTEGFFPITILGDKIKEADENFFVSISDPNGARLGSATAQITLNNDKTDK